MPSLSLRREGLACKPSTSFVCAPHSLSCKTQPGAPISRTRLRPTYRPTYRPTRCRTSIRSHLPSPPQDTSAVEARVMAWARLIVCGLNLCPFAEAALSSNTVRVHVSAARTERAVRAAVASETALLLCTSKAEMSTSLLVLPRFASADFRRFHALCVELEDAIERDDALVDDVMLACFHPRHEWAGDVGEALHFDKRAPYPVINFLRAEVVDRYVGEGKTQRILQRNQETLERVGVERLREMYRSLMMVGEGG